MYKDLFQISNELMVIAEVDGTFVQTNPAFKAALGWTDCGLGEETLFSLVHVEDVESVERSMTKMATGAQVYRFVCRMRNSRGRYLSISWDIAPMPHGEDLYLFAAGRDVTEELHTLEELRRANRDLNDFASVASHELRSPLRRIVGLCEILKEDHPDCVDENAQGILDGIVRETYAMEDVVTSLLQYTRVKSGGQDMTPVKLLDVLRTAKRSVLKDYEGRGEPEIHLVHPFPTVDGDAGQLVLLFENLFSNGLKFNRNDTPTIRVEYDALAMRLRIEDNGVGIPQTHTERVFEMFERATAEFPGHGVGLALCRRIAERHHGHLWVDRTSEDGTQFALSIRPSSSLSIPALSLPDPS